MTLRITRDLAALSSGDLSEELTSLANQIRDALADGQTVDVLELLDQLQTSSRKARGPQLDLLEVACALLKAVTRTNLGRPELAAHQLLSAHGDAGEAFFERVLAHPVPPAEVARLPSLVREHVGRLVDLGVLRQAGGHLDVAPQYRPFMDDLLEPLPLRHWREVTDARSEIFSQHMNEGKAASHLAGLFGIREGDAIRHLRRHPPEWICTVPASRYQRPPILRPQAQAPNPAPREETVEDPPNRANDLDLSPFVQGDVQLQ